MTLFDYGVIVVLACSVLISLLRGLIKEILSLMSWVIGLFVANAYCASFAGMLPAVLIDFVPSPAARPIVAFVALFIIVKVFIALFAVTIDAVIKASGLTMVDRGLGGLFGLARGIVMVLVIALACGMTGIPQTPFWKEALLSPIAESAASAAMPFLPGVLAERVKF